MSGIAKNWQKESHEARLWHKLEDGRVQCRLSPRGCQMKEDQPGFCGVRKNIGGELRTLNYGKSIHATQEFVETEALFHFAPGAKILSMGNLGCMMNCSYCHNWKTSQARYVSDADVHYYTPERVVEICLEKKIPIISWTYNDPVVWHEFILDTAKLAKKHGILNLYKSAFYISEEAAHELTEHMDVFSLSLKSMDPEFYRRLTKGTLEPVLKAIKLVVASKKHLELSNLMVTDANDSESDAAKVAQWVLDNASDTTPLHFVRFHPDYQYTKVGRTPIDRLERAREKAMAMGLKYVYMGNVFDRVGVHTYCPKCSKRVIARYGMNTRLDGIDPMGACKYCGFKMPFTSLSTSFNKLSGPAGSVPLETSELFHEWRGDILSFHVEVKNNSEKSREILIRRLIDGSIPGPVEQVSVLPKESYRFVVSRGSADERGISILSETGLSTQLFDLLDRAHFPTTSN